MDDKPLCLLALDGGGIRGLSELVVLEEIMNRIKHDLNADEDLLPADFFDLIGGTSTGGLIALLLGRLRQSVPQARKEYVRIAKEVFSLPSYLKKNKFDGQKLEVAIKRLLGKGRSEEKMLEKENNCKVFVCAVPQQDVKARAGPRLFRTYRVRENASFNCTIWEACRATSAAPSYFEPIDIGDDGEKETFVDGGLGYNNPVEQVLDEASRIFPGRKVACIVSIGTGVASVITFPGSPKKSPVRLITALKNMATESDTTAEKIHKRFQNVQDTYFRFSVDRGLQGIGIEECEELHKVRTFTTDYIGQQTVSNQINKVAMALLVSRIVGQEGASKLIQLPRDRSDIKGSQQLSQTLEWRPDQESLPSFHYTTQQLASHIIEHLFSERHFIVPFSRNKDFVGRNDQVKKLLAKVSPEPNQESCQLTVLEGLGGVGKTQIALEVAFQVHNQHSNSSVLWTSAVDRNSFENSYRKIGQELKIEGIDEDNADVKTLVKTKLGSEDVGSWLLIVDNVDRTDLFGDIPLADYLPSSSKGSILLTTRNHDVASSLDIPSHDIITVKAMTQLEGFEFLGKHLKEDQLYDAASTAKLLEALVCLPLAMRQACAYIARCQITTAKYLDLYLSSDENMIELLNRDFEDRYRYKNIRNPVATTWWISFEHISEHDPLAAEYLRFMCFLAEKDIPRSLLPPATRLQAEEAIGTLKAYAFVTEREEGNVFDMHRLVRLTMQKWLANEGDLKSYATAVIQRLADVFPYPEHENRSIWIGFVSHVFTALEFGADSTDNAAKAQLLYNLATAVFTLGNYREAEKLFRQTLALQTEILGGQHDDTLFSIYNLANAISNQGNYEEAEQLYRQTLALRTEILGGQHPDTLTSMHGLANTISNQGNYEEAEQLHRQTLALRTEILGGRHPDTLRTMHNLAFVISGLGNDEEAEKLYRQTLALQTEILGGRHPHTLQTIHNLAIVIYSQGSDKVAEKLLRQTLALQTEILGSQHPNTLHSMENLAIAASNQGNYKEAEQIYRQTLTLWTKVLGAEHPRTLRIMNSLAIAVAKQGDDKGIKHRLKEMDFSRKDKK